MSEKMPMNERKRCPHCRGEGDMVDDPTYGYGMFSTVYYVECRECGARTADYFSPEEAEDAWNRRDLEED